LRDPGAQPAYLPAVANLVLGDMKPREVRVHGGSGVEGPFQPRVIVRGERFERETAYLAELVHVVLERLAAKEPAPLGTERQRRLPRCLLERRGAALFEGDNLIPTLDRSDVRQKRADRVAAAIVKMIELCHGQSFDGRKRRAPRISQHTHQPPDRGRVTWQRFYAE